MIIRSRSDRIWSAVNTRRVSSTIGRPKARPDRGFCHPRHMERVDQRIARASPPGQRFRN